MTEGRFFCLRQKNRPSVMQQHNGPGGQVDGRQPHRICGMAYRAHADGGEAFQCAQEGIGAGIDLKLSVAVAPHQVAHTHDLGIQPIPNGLQHLFLRVVFAQHVFVVHRVDHKQLVLVHSSKMDMAEEEKAGNLPA